MESSINVIKQKHTRCSKGRKSKTLPYKQLYTRSGQLYTYDFKDCQARDAVFTNLMWAFSRDILWSADRFIREIRKTI